MSQTGLVEFTKSHGLGNDFIIIEDLDEELDLNESTAKALCDRHFGIGADGVILVRGSMSADFFMHYINADGSIAQMCGNGIRVFARYLYDNLLKKPLLKIDTLAGVREVRMRSSNGMIEAIEVDMGVPELRSERIPLAVESDDFIDRPIEANGRNYSATCVSMGNPHCVVFVDDIESARVQEDGPIIENLAMFPEKTNVEFAQVIGEHHLSLRVWERGVGETLACGTGACASLVAAHVTGKTGRRALVVLPGGDITVLWEKDDHIMMSGGAEPVFTGRINLEELRK